MVELVKENWNKEKLYLWFSRLRVDWSQKTTVVKKQLVLNFIIICIDEVHKERASAELLTKIL